MTRPIVLASTSPYRRELLGRLQLPFSVDDPATDETPLRGESAEETALRLAQAKARAVASRHPEALIIGSDQVAVCEGRVYGKPGNHAGAVRQLTELSGRTVNFFTGVSLLDSQSGRCQVRGIPTLVRFRHLEPSEIERYLEREQAYNCAGSAKSEGLGISLLAALEGSDPTALIGLPWIGLCDMLRQEGLALP